MCKEIKAMQQQNKLNVFVQYGRDVVQYGRDVKYVCNRYCTLQILHGEIARLWKYCMVVRVCVSSVYCRV